MDHTIDAKHKALGRLATEIATILQGKTHPNYDPKFEGEDRVIIQNIEGIVLSGRKTTQKIYYNHTGPLGHLKERKYREVFAKDPMWVLQHAVRLMLPKNKLAARRLKRIVLAK